MKSSNALALFFFNTQAFNVCCFVQTRTYSIIGHSRNAAATVSISSLSAEPNTGDEAYQYSERLEAFGIKSAPRIGRPKAVCPPPEESAVNKIEMIEDSSIQPDPTSTVSSFPSSNAEPVGAASSFAKSYVASKNIDIDQAILSFVMTKLGMMDSVETFDEFVRIAVLTDLEGQLQRQRIEEEKKRTASKATKDDVWE
jgi:hypothetical protein